MSSHEIRCGGSDGSRSGHRRNVDVLLAWEHGRSLEQVARQTELVRRFGAAGARIALAVPPKQRADGMFAGAGVARVAAPRSRVPPGEHPERMHSFADILIALGFADRQALSAVVADWLRLFERHAPSAVVLDCAPAAQLAAMIAGLPAVQVTNGFAAPPPNCPVFGVDMRGSWLEQRNAQRVAQLSDTLSAVARMFGSGADISLATWLAYPRRWYDCIEQTDPYGPRTNGVYLGSIGHPGVAQAHAWPAGPPQAPKVLAYLSSEDQVWMVLPALRRIGARALVVWPHGNELAISSLQAPGLRVVNRPVDLDIALPASDFVVNDGSTNIVCRTLLARKPQLMLPADAESWLVSRRVVQCGAGLLEDSRDGDVRLADSLAGLMPGRAIAGALASMAIRPAAELGHALDKEIASLLAQMRGATAVRSTTIEQVEG